MNKLVDIEGGELWREVDYDKTTVSILDPTETKSNFKTKQSDQRRTSLNNQVYFCKVLKASQVNHSETNNDTPNSDILSSIILSKYKNTNQPSNSTSKNPDQDLAIVKFHVKEGVIVASAFKLTARVGYVKECFADVLELDENLFSLEFEGKELDPLLALTNFDLIPMQKISFNVRSKTGETGKKRIVQKVDENIPTLTVITVHCIVGGNVKDIIVEIKDQCCDKEWLGGFRNSKTNIDYHHAQTQTARKTRKTFEYTETGKEYLLFHRDTQTPYPLKSVKVDTSNSKATQMCRSDLYITSKSDKIIIPRTYVDFERHRMDKNVEKSVIIIQRAVKKWILKKRIQLIVELEMKIVKSAKRQKDYIREEEAVKERVVITGAANPVKRDDFYMLYLMVGNWWKKEWKRINETRSKETKQAEIVALLQKHVKLLQEIERHKAIGKKEALKKEKMRFLNIISQPITFKNSKGKMTSIDDIDTQRAREFKEICSALMRQEIPTNDRIEALFVLKNLISRHYMDYEYANDLVSLINREVHLLSTGFKGGDLKGLRIRIEQLFMNLLENNEFNPKAATYKKPNISKTLPIQIQCYRCKRLLPVSMFPIHVRMKKYTEGGCKSCTWMQNLGNQRVDMSPFVKLSKQVQNSEMEKCCYSAVCFIFQPIGLAYLTMKIWHGHSAISECRDISKLRHVRWLKEVEWAPWNTILLTNQEAKCHTSIPNIFEFYDQSFVNSVQQKHILARTTFKPLLIIDHDLSTSGVWANVQDEGRFLHPSHAEAFATANEYDQI